MEKKRKLRLLIIDDNQDLLMALGDFLSRKFEVVQSGASLDALKIFQEQQSFDIIVSDYMLPMYDGVDLLQRFRAVNPWLCTVLMTVHCSLGLALRAVNSGAVDRIVSKPFNNVEFLNTIESAIEERDNKLKTISDFTNQANS